MLTQCAMLVQYKYIAISGDSFPRNALAVDTSQTKGMSHDGVYANSAISSYMPILREHVWHRKSP